MPYGRPDQGGATPSELGYDPNQAPIIQNWQVQGNVLFQTEDFYSGVWVQSGVGPPVQNTAALQGPNGSGSFWEVTSGGATTFIGQSRSPAVPFIADSLYYSIVLAGGPGATSTDVGVFAQAVLEGKAQTVVINPANGTIVSQTGNADEVVLSSVEIAGRLFTTVTIRLDNISTGGNSLDLRVLPDTSGGSGVAIIGSPMIAESITDGTAGAIPRAPAYVLSSSGSQNGQHFAGKFARIQVNDAMESHEWDYTSAPTYVAGDQTLGRVIRPVGGTGAFAVQVPVFGSNPGGLANGFYFFIDPSALNSATDSITLVAGAAILVFQSFTPTNIGSSGTIWSSAVLTSAPLLMVVRNDADTESSAVYRVYPMGTLGGGGGVAEPAGQVVFGTGAGVNSDPGFTFDAATGALQLSSTPVAAPGTVILQGWQSTSLADGGAVTIQGGGNFAGGAAGNARVIGGNAGAGNGGNVEITAGEGLVGPDGQIIFTTAGLLRFAMLANGGLSVGGSVGTALQALLSQGPGLPPVWGTALQSFVGSFTRDLTLASGTQIVSGIGFTPKAVLFWAGDLATTFIFSWGFGMVGSGFCVDFGALATLKSDALSTDPNGAGIDFQRGEILSVASGQFTINWTKVGLPLGTANIGYLALG